MIASPISRAFWFNYRLKNALSIVPACILKFCVTIFLLGCNQVQSEEPILSLPLPVMADPGTFSDQLEFAAKTDQSDRALLTEKDLLDMIQRRSNKLLDTIDYRDSIRIEQVLNIYDSGVELTCKDKYNIALVFLHTGGANFNPDFDMFQVSADLFSEVLQDSNCVLLFENSRWFHDEALRRKNIKYPLDRPQFGLFKIK